MNTARVAYLSMEIALDPRMPTYAGGLGILAGDTIRAAADLHVPMVAITLLHRKGYLCQRLDASGWQHEDPCEWQVENFATEAKPRVIVQIEGRPIHIRAWQFVDSRRPNRCSAALRIYYPHARRGWTRQVSTRIGHASARLESRAAQSVRPILRRLRR
jgi:glucan phosphorylase